MRRVAAVRLFLICIIASPGLAQSDSNWLFPADQQLLAAARRGFEGHKPKPIYILGTPMYRRPGKVGLVEFQSPLYHAQFVGKEKRDVLSPVSDPSEFAMVRGQFAVRVVFWAKWASETDASAEIELSQGGRVLRPTSQEGPNRSREQCDCPPWMPCRVLCWEISTVYQFSFEPGTWIPLGRWNLVVRPSQGKSKKAVVDFDRIAGTPP
jgi:hypothetical protein